MINVRTSNGGAQTQTGPAQTYLNGYRKTIDGQVLSYHSSNPDADMALLVRANKEAHSVTWDTDTLTDPAPDDFYHLVWLAGLDRAGWGENSTAHRFDLFINGRPAFSFRNFKDSTAEHWRVAGKAGAELAFESRMADKFGDLFGYMFLTLPKKEYPAGSPLTLRVEGENGESLEWYMTFQYRFNFTPRLRVEPALMRRGIRTTQSLRLSLDNLRGGRTIEIDAPGEEPVVKPLNVGANIFLIPIPVVPAETTVTVGFTLDGGAIVRSEIRVPPVIKRTVYLLSYSHNDIGYTDLQTAVERKQWNNIEEALRLIDKTRDYPQDARYKWNLEGLFPVEGYMRQASEERRRQFLEAVRAGSIGLNALYANMLTGLANAVEMSHFTSYARHFTKEYSIPITTAVESDVPGFSWGMVSALAQSGVKYFASAPNPFDRIGYALEAWGDKPFWWTSQSGRDKVLMWVAGASYASFHEGQLAKLGDEKILKLMRKLDDSGYPYEIVHLPYTLGDNGPPDSLLPDAVKDWNERYVSPRLIIATHAEMFKAFEAKYGAGLPVVKGDFTPYWEDGAASTASETALNRHAVDRLIQGEALWSMLAPAAYPSARYDTAWRNAVLWDEHTWGASNSISEPDDPGVKGQWQIKQRFALDAESLAVALSGEALHSATGEKVHHGKKSISEDPSPRKEEGANSDRGKHSRTSGTAIDIYNTSSWTRTDLVLLPPAESTAGDRVIDEERKPVPSQRLTTGELAILARDIPPLSAKRFIIEKGAATKGGDVSIAGDVLSNGLLTVTVDRNRGSIAHLVVNRSGKDLVDGSQGMGLNEFYYIPGSRADSLLSLKHVSVKIKEKGNLLGSFIVEGEAPGCKTYTSEIRLVAGLSRVDVVNDIDKLMVREKEAADIVYPFNVPGGQIRYDVANAFVRPEEDQLAGSCKNFYSVQGCVDISNGEYGLTWVTVDAPVVELGSITAEHPWLKSAQPSPLVSSYIMNNYWHTNYKADQSGPVRFRYSILPHAEFKSEAAARSEIECRQPLIAVAADPRIPPARTLFTLEPAGVIALSVKPADEGRARLLYLFNPTDTDQKVSVKTRGLIPAPLRPSDPSGRILGERVSRFDVAAHGSGYVLVEGK